MVIRHWSGLVLALAVMGCTVMVRAQQAAPAAPAATAAPVVPPGIARGDRPGGEIGDTPGE